MDRGWLVEYLVHYVYSSHCLISIDNFICNATCNGCSIKGQRPSVYNRWLFYYPFFPGTSGFYRGDISAAAPLRAVIQMEDYMKTTLSKLLHGKRKIISILLTLSLLISFFPMSDVFAWSPAANVTINKTVSVSYFTNKWGTPMTSGFYYLADTNEIAYCADQEGTGPGGTGYSLSDGGLGNASYLAGIQRIIQNGYPFVTNGLSANDARYATQMAIHWIESYYLGGNNGYDYTIRNDGMNANGHDGCLAFALSLYDIGVSGAVVIPTVNLDAPTAWTAVGGVLQCTVHVTQNNTLNWEITSLPAGVTAVGGNTFIGDVTLTLRQSDPAAYAAASNKKIAIQGYCNIDTSNIHVFVAGGSWQSMVAVSTQSAGTDPAERDLASGSGPVPTTPPDGPTQPPDGPTQPPDGPTQPPEPTGHGSASIYKSKYALSNPGGTMASEAGATFAVYDDTGSMVDTLTTNSSGMASSSHEYPMGTYTIVQTFSPVNYFTFLMGYSLSFTVVEGEGQLFSYNASNIIYEQYIRVLKTDSETGDVVRLAGATFEVLASDGTTVLSDSNGNTEFTTDATGTIALTDLPLVVGSYYIKEIQAPIGYVLNENLLSFSVSIFEHGTSSVTVENSKDVKNIYFADKPQKCEIQIEKYGDYLYTTEKIEASDSAGVRLTDINSNPLSIYNYFYIAKEKTTATFEVTVGDKDIVDQDGNVKLYDADKDGVNETPLKAGTSLGLIKLWDPTCNVMTNLPLDGITATAEYYVTETGAPFGDLLAGRGAWLFTYADQHIEIIVNRQQIYDARQKLQVKIQKYKEQGVWNAEKNDYDWIYVPAEGILFGLYTRDNVYGDLGSVQIPAGTLVDVLETDSTGVAVTTKDITFGSYYVKEINVTPDVVIDERPFDVSAMPVDQKSAAATVTTANDTQPLINKAVAGKVNIYKLAADTALPMPGVVFEVYDKDGILVDTVTTNAGGHAITRVLPYGQYTLIETKTLTGYALADKQTININVSQLMQRDGDTFSEAAFVIIDQKMAQVEVFKVTGDGTQTPMNGVIFGVYNSKTSAEVARITTDSKGYGSVYVMAGNYYMKEISTWEGYALSAEKIPVAAEFAHIYTFHQTNSLTELRVLKTSTSGKALSGMKFTVTETTTGRLITFIYDADKNAYVASYVLSANKEMSVGAASKSLFSAFTGKNGMALILGLKPGTYTVTEIQAPNGYNRDSKPVDAIISDAATSIGVAS